MGESLDMLDGKSPPAGLGAAPPRARVSLKRNVAHTFMGNLVYGGCQWAVLVVIAKMGTPEMMGRFALAFAITAPLIMAAKLQLRGVQATDARGAYVFGDYLGLAMVMLGLAALVVGACAVLFYPGETGIVIVIVAAAKIAESVSEVYLGFLQRHERMDWVSRSLMVKGVASVAGLVSGLYLGESLPWGVLGLAAGWAAVLALYDIPRAVRLSAAVGGPPLRPRWRGPALRGLAWLALPLGVAALMTSLQVNVPRYFVERLLGPRELGFFASAAYLMIVGGRFMTALGESASPRLADYYAAGDERRFRRLVLRMLAVMSAVAGGAVVLALLLGRPLLSLVYRPEYGAQAHVLVVLLAAAGVNYAAVLLEYAMTASRVLRVQPAILGASTVVIALACLALVPRHGNLGAALAMCLGFLVQLAGNALATGAAVWRLRSSR